MVCINYSNFSNFIDSNFILFICGINKELPAHLAKSNTPLYNFLINKWYFDEIYDFIFIQSSKKIG